MVPCYLFILYYAAADVKDGPSPKQYEGTAGRTLLPCSCLGRSFIVKDLTGENLFYTKHLGTQYQWSRVTSL